MGDVVNTFSILESVNYLEPSRVETVHIIDATSEPSDTDTCCSTPNLEDRPVSKISIDVRNENEEEEEDEESDEYETGEPAPLETLSVTHARLPYNGQEKRALLQKDRDLLKDSEQIDGSVVKVPPKPARKRLTPTLKEILSAADRDSYYGSDKECGYDEPLTFSDDEDDNDDGTAAIDKQIDVDDEHRRDTVLMKHPPIETKQKLPPKNVFSLFFLCFVACALTFSR